MTSILNSCTADNISHAKDACNFVREACADPEKSSQIYYELYYCYLNQSNLAFTVLTILFFLCAFYLLSSTAEIYLSPALSKLSTKLNLSETLAGVTLVAFSNGAPDIISSFSAGESLEGVPLVIGSIFGGGIFILTTIVALVILSAKSIRAEKYFFLRDLGFYIAAILYVMVMGAIGYINLYSILGFVFLFPCYIVVVFIMERKLKSTQSLSSHLLEDVETNLSYKSMKDEYDVKKPMAGIELNSQFLHETHTSASSSSPPSKKESVSEAFESIESDNKQKGKTTKNYSETPSTDDASLETRHTMLNEMGREERGRCWGCLNTFDKIIRAFQAPFLLVRSLTIPAVDDELWSKPFALVQPWTCGWFFLLITGYFFETVYGYWIGLYLLPFQILATGLIWKFTSDHELPSFEFPLIIGGLVFSIFWIYQVAVLTVEYLEFVGFVAKIHPTLLGMSLLAWGNSMQDLFGNRSLAKLGYGLMALTGCFAGSLFNLLVGFGSSMLRQVWNSKNHRVEFHIFSFSNENLEQGSLLSMGVLLFSFINVLIILTYSFAKQFKFSRGFAVFLLIFYGIFLSVSTISAFHLKELNAFFGLTN